MSESPALQKTVQPEHRIFWTARAASEVPESIAMLRGFFARYAKNSQRLFPWRKPGIPPFELLAAELLLVQTKAEDVARVWPTLIARYPSPERLARAQTRYLTRLLQPLGLQNQRARALKELSLAIVKRFGGDVPQSMPELLSLPHVGLYVASAVSCFNHGRRVPIVDANVIRVFGRIIGVDAGKELRRCPKIWETAWGLLPTKNFARHNYGLLDFAAQVCRTRAPLCSSCQLNATCAYGRTTLKPDAGDQSNTGAMPACSI
jgi:A/G-specific adenine glycosylase